MCGRRRFRSWRAAGRTTRKPPWLKDRARSDEHWDVRQAAVQELPRSWKDDPETLPLLKDRARLDENEFVRQAAVQELARAWTRTSFVRQAAVQELAHGWKDDPKPSPC